MEQFLEKGFGQFVGFLCVFCVIVILICFAVYISFFFQTGSERTSQLGSSDEKFQHVDTQKRSRVQEIRFCHLFVCFSVLPILLMRTQFGPFFTPVWLFNSLIVRVWDEVKCFFNPKKVQIRIGGWSLPFFNVLGGCGCDSREICAGDLWWFSAFEACLIQVARTWIHPASMALTYPVEKGLAVGKM